MICDEDEVLRDTILRDEQRAAFLSHLLAILQVEKKKEKEKRGYELHIKS